MGKLSALSRKTCAPIAHAFGVRRENLQDFMGCSPWSDRLILDELHRHVTQTWGDPQGVFLGDGSGFAKKGEHSCGVKRQYCGRLGKVDNCQLGVFLGYACQHGHTLLEHPLFLPPEWASDPKRRAKAGVPKEIVFQETWEMLLDELNRCRNVPHAWFTCDSEFGRVNAFRAGLRQRGERYVVEVCEDLRVRDVRECPRQRPAENGTRRYGGKRRRGSTPGISERGGCRPGGSSLSRPPHLARRTRQANLRDLNAYSRISDASQKRRRRTNASAKRR